MNDTRETDRSLRVLHVTATTQRRGAEVFAADLIGALDDVEHRVAYLRPAAGAPLAFPCTMYPLPGRPGPIGLVAAARALRGIVARFRPDVVQAHGGEALRLAVAAGTGRQCPIVYRRIGMAPPPMRTGWRRQWHSWLMGRAATVVCVAEAVREEALERFGLDQQRTVTIANAVSATRLGEEDGGGGGQRAALGLAADARVVLSLGSLSWEKDPLGALDVTAELLRSDPLGAHVFAGDGPLRGALEAKVVELGLEAQVRVVGPRHDVGPLLAAADVVLFASGPDSMEGMPATVIEGGLAGRPVVAFDVAGIAEVIENGVSGVVVGAGDRAALRSAVASLLADPARRRALGAAASVRCSEHFTIEVVAPLYRRVWEQAARHE